MQNYSRLYETNFNCFSYKGKNDFLICLLTTLGKVILLKVHFLNLLLIKIGHPFFSSVIFFFFFDAKIKLRLLYSVSK